MLNKIQFIVLFIAYILFSVSSTLCQIDDIRAYSTSVFNNGLPPVNTDILSHLSFEEYSYALIVNEHTNDSLFILKNISVVENIRLWMMRRNDEGDYQTYMFQFEEIDSVTKSFKFSLDAGDSTFNYNILLSESNEALIYKYVISRDVYYDASLLVESFILDTEGFEYKSGENEKGWTFYPFSFYYNGAILFDEKFRIEMRAGILVAGDYFSGPEFGLFLSRNIYNSLFMSIGIMGTLIGGNAHGTSVYEEVEQGIYYKLGLSLGLKLNSSAALLLSYYKTQDEYYGYNYDTGVNKRYLRYLYSIVKLGVIYNF